MSLSCFSNFQESLSINSSTSAGDAFSSGIFLAELKISISVSLFQFLSFFDIDKTFASLSSILKFLSNGKKQLR